MISKRALQEQIDHLEHSLDTKSRDTHKSIQALRNELIPSIPSKPSKPPQDIKVGDIVRGIESGTLYEVVYVDAPKGTLAVQSHSTSSKLWYSRKAFEFVARP